MYKDEDIKYPADIVTLLTAHIMTKAIKQIAAAAVLITFILGASAPITAQIRNGTGPAAAPYFGNVEAITAKQLKDYLTVIASGELEGRHPRHPADRASRHYTWRSIQRAGTSSQLE